jgi:hypothetical protein
MPSKSKTTSVVAKATSSITFFLTQSSTTLRYYYTPALWSKTSLRISGKVSVPANAVINGSQGKLPATCPTAILMELDFDPDAYDIDVHRMSWNGTQLIPVPKGK